MLEQQQAPFPTTPFPVDAIRSVFPAISHTPKFIFFDNAAGAQIPQLVFDAVNHHLLTCNVQRGGRYAKSRNVDATVARARLSVGDLLNARDPREIAFGMNASSFVRLVSTAIGRMLGTRNEIILTDMDHQANIAPWLALEYVGAKVVWWKMREDYNLHVEDLAALLTNKTRLVACTIASNAHGSTVDVTAAARLAHSAGAEIFLDCVHYAPHGLIDVQAFDCDYLVCSGYKIFSPHMAMLWGRLELLQQLRISDEELTPTELPDKMEPGTFVYENVAGMEAAVAYLETLETHVECAHTSGQSDCRRARLVRSMHAVRTYEAGLSRKMVSVLRTCGAIIYGVPDAQIDRLPTLSFNLKNILPARVTETMAAAGIGIRDGHMYCPRMIKRFGLSLETGVVRASLLHYNTVQEIDEFANVLNDLARHN